VENSKLMCEMLLGLRKSSYTDKKWGSKCFEYFDQVATGVVRQGAVEPGQTKC
jgi:hypothetical protein